LVQHYKISLPALPRGYHLITAEVLSAIDRLPRSAIVHLFIKHTSAGLTINENADADVRVDFESIFNKLIPENMPFLTHTMEGPDDMPAHIKASIVGSSISIPVVDGELDLGIWQGIYLCEFRDNGGARQLVASVYS